MQVISIEDGGERMYLSFHKKAAQPYYGMRGNGKGTLEFLEHFMCWGVLKKKFTFNIWEDIF